MASSGEAVLGTFRAPGDAAGAIRALRDRGFGVRAAMPAAFPEVVRALGDPRSHIDRITFAGALLGLACGVLFTAGTSLAWPLVTGGKPVVSIPPFAVIAFELTILFGCLATLVAVVVRVRRGGGRAGAFPPGVAFDGVDVGVLASGGDPREAERILRALGAAEVRRVA